MEVKIGNKTTKLSRDAIASNMAILLTTRVIVLQREHDFKTTFQKYKSLCLAFLTANPKFVYAIGDDSWTAAYFEFENAQSELLTQEVFFAFTDGTSWAISLSVLADMRIAEEPTLKNKKSSLLLNPYDLIEWAERKLSWPQLKEIASLRDYKYIEETYIKEWPKTEKQVVKWKHDPQE